MADITGYAGPGLIDEHAPRLDESGTQKPGDAPDYNPTEDEKKAIKLAEKVFERNKKHRAQYDIKWLDYYHMFRGKQWKEQRPSYRHSEVINLVFRTIQSLVPIQLDPRPKFEFLPQDPSDYPLSLVMNQVAEADWTTKNWGYQLLEVVYDSNFYGTGMSSLLVKDDLGRPELIYKSADPFYTFPDPEAMDVNVEGTTLSYSDQAATFVYAEPVDVRKIKKKYPQVKDYIKPDIQDLLRGSKTNTQPVKFRSPIDNKVILEGSSTMDLVDKDRALLVSVWLSPEYCSEDFIEEQQQGEVDPESGVPGPPCFVQKAKYPNGRKIVVCNGILCEDVDNGYDDGLFPFQRLPNYVLPREFWGMSEIEQLEGPQKTFNKLVSFVLDVLTLTGNPVWIVPSSSGIDPDNLLNKPGLVIEHDGGPESAPHREPGVQLQPFVLQLIDKMAQWFDTLGGSNDVTRGVQPVGVTAAAAISSLQEAAQTRIRQKSRLTDYYLQTLGQQYASRVMQFKTVPQVYRLTNDQGVSQWFRMYVEPYQATDPNTGVPLEDGEPMFQVHYQPFTPDGKLDPDQAKIFQTRGKFDLKVSTGSALPFEKDELQTKLLALFDRHIIDAEEVLKRSDYPNYQAVLLRMQQAAQQAAQAQGQQQAQGGGKPGPGAPPARPGAQGAA